MSIEIVYDRTFLKTPAGNIYPLILVGSSNCTEFHFTGNGFRERRERYWSYFWGPDMLGIPAEELVAKVEAICNGPESKELFRLNSHYKWITTETCPDWYRNGIRTAATIEDTLLVNPGTSLKGFLRLYPDKDPKNACNEMEKYIHTSQELDSWTKAAKQKRKDALAAGADAAYICLKFSDNEPLRSGNLPDGPVIARQNSGRKLYLIGLSDRGTLTFGPDPSTALVFNDPREAVRLVGRAAQLSFLKASKSNQRSKSLCLRFTSGRYFGQFVYRRSNGCLQATHNRVAAKTFRNPREARKYAHTLYQNFRAYNGSLEILDLETGITIPVPSS